MVARRLGKFLGILVIGMGLSMMAFVGMFVLGFLAGKNSSEVEFWSWLSAFSVWGGHLHGVRMRLNSPDEWVVERALGYSLRYMLLFACLLAALVVLGGYSPSIANTVLPAGLFGWLPWFLAFGWHVYWEPSSHLPRQAQTEPIKIKC